jgi:plastocyanin
MPLPVNYTVTIAVDPDSLWPSGKPAGASCGNFVYSPALIRVSAGDTITWTCNHPFALTFKEGTPVDEVQLTGTGSGPYSTGARTVADVKGQYHYAVAVWDGSQVHLDASCAVASVN